MQDLAKRWLAMVAGFYAAVFLAACFALAAPACLASLWPGVELARLELLPYGFLASAAPIDMSHDIERLISATTIGVPIILLALFLFLRQFTFPIIGLTYSLYGFALIQPLFMALFSDRAAQPLQLASSFLGLVCIYVGFGALVNPISIRWHRPLFLALGLIAPAAFAASQFLRMPRRAPTKYLAIETATAAVLALLSAIPATKLASPTTTSSILAALLLSLSLGAIVNLKQTRQTDTRKATLEQELSTLPETKPQPYIKHFLQKGVSFTAEFPAFYGERTSRKMLNALPSFGVNSIALIPYGPIRRQGSWESDIGMEILVRQAHQQGMRVMLKPHTRKPSEQDLSDQPAIDEWFRNHERFIVDYARFAEKVHADLFCVGTEFGWLSRYDIPWRRIISEVRKVYGGPLVYAPNHGPEFEQIRFWDDLDYIGIDNYYPLGENYSTTGILDRVQAVQAKFGKPVLFTEAGYSAAVGAHKEPWADETNYPLSLEEQARCYQALLAAFYDKPWFQGVYWWKVGTNGYGGPSNNSMTPWRKPAMEILKRYYLNPTR